MRNFFQFIMEGKREEAKMNELLDILTKRKLTPEEHELLVSLSKGESLPEEEKEVLKMHKTGGGFLYDDEGNILTQKEEEEIKPGQEFTTIKGKTRSTGREEVKPEEFFDARVYRNKDNEERFIYVHRTDDEGVHDWIIYRTDGGKEFGKILDTNLDKLKHYKSTTPEQLWKELDYRFDYGMVLDQDICEDIINFAELYKAGGKGGSRNIMDRLHRRFCTLL